MRNPLPRICIFVLALTLTAGTAQAQGLIDALRGEAIARVWCANCHLVSDDEQRPVSVDAPAFAALTEEAGYTDERLRGFLNLPHGPMEGFAPDNRQIGDLIAYIRSLQE